MAAGQAGSAEFAGALRAGLSANSPAPLHRAALELLPATEGEQLVREARLVLKNRSVGEKQHVISLLAQAAQPTSDALLGELAGAVLAGTGTSDLTFDVLEALRGRAATNHALAAKLSAYSGSNDARAQKEFLSGGDTDLGREVVLNHLNANCLACHSGDAKAGGSAVGPNLSGIGRRAGCRP